MEDISEVNSRSLRSGACAIGSYRRSGLYDESDQV